MSFQVEHLPQDRPATREERWPFNLESFLEDQWLYLLAIAVLLGLFLYARYSRKKRNNK